MTVLEALKQEHKVETGFVCLSSFDIRCVDGICNKDGQFWTIEVNGNFQDYNTGSLVKPKDAIVLKYGRRR